MTEKRPEGSSTNPRLDSPPPPPEYTVLDANADSAGAANDSTAGPSLEPPQSPGVNRHYRFSTAPDDEDLPPDQPPPAYTELPGQIHNNSNDIGTNAVVAEDGRVNIRINQKSRTLSQIFYPQLQQQLSRVQTEPDLPPPYIPESLGGAPGQEAPPSLNVVIHVVGSRGDVQPFVALGKVLKETYKHRVRLATHPTFKDFVTENGLEFFSIGGDPAELMAFMVKNPGLMPGFDTLRSGDVGKRRRGIAEILRGTWRSCIETGDGLCVDPIKQNVEEWMAGGPDNSDKCFVADVIIANPPSFGHIHCAEKLGIPLHMMFTMPWSPTQQFPHPLANIQSSNADASITNYISYTLVDMLTWQGLGDVINDFRRKSLGLEPVSMMQAPGVLDRLKIPYTYCWSPALIPKPKDWGQHISISGFYFLKLAQNYTPAPDLKAFLEAGEPPVYIGFGSIVVDDPNAMTTLIFEAIKKTGKRALVSKGWGGLGANELDVPEGVFMLGNVPHDWLFQRVSCVVHHGGAGTTAAGIAAGRPTVVVPFFGDQPFWGAMTAKAGAGPPPIPYKDLTADSLAESIQKALTPESLERAQELSRKISAEQGDQTGAQSFHQHLKLDQMRCAIQNHRSAAWRVKRTTTKLSAMTVAVLVKEGELRFDQLKLYRPTEYDLDSGPIDPITGGATALIGTMTEMLMGVADFPEHTLKVLQIHPDMRKSKGKRPVGAPDGSTSNSSSFRGRSRQTTIDSNGSGSSSPSTVHGTGSTSNAPTISSATQDTAEAPSDSGPASPGSRPSFMAQAMRAANHMSRSRSRDRSEGSERNVLRKRPTDSHSRTTSDASFDPSTARKQAPGFTADSAIYTGKGLAKIVGAGFKSPMDFSLNVAKGFHNVPKLYGQEVRQVDKVTDLQSGVKTAAKEFGMGLYEGIGGLVMDPYRGAKKEGGAGFLKGVGTGIAGLPLRVMGGAFSVPGYAMKGLYQEILKGQGANIQHYIIAARIAQGNEEATMLPAAERAEMVRKWKAIRSNMTRKKNPGEEQLETLQKVMKEHKAKKRDKWQKRFDSIQKYRNEGRPTFAPSIDRQPSYSDPTEDGGGGQDARRPSGTPSSISSLYQTQSSGSSHPTRNQSQVSIPPSHQQPAELAALRSPVELESNPVSRTQSTSNNTANTAEDIDDEDELFDRAIRASIAELQSHDPDPNNTLNDDEEDEALLQRAIQASLEEASKSGATEEEQRMLEETIRNSIAETRRRRSSDSEWDSDSDTEDDEDYRRIIAESERVALLQQQGKGDLGLSEGAGDGAEELQRVVEESERMERERKEEEERELRRLLEESERVEVERRKEEEERRREEEIVMEYVKRQSLVEEEHRRRMVQGREEMDTHTHTQTGTGGGGESSRDGGRSNGV